MNVCPSSDSDQSFLGFCFCFPKALSVVSFPQDGASIGSSQLNQSLRQVSRAVVISPPSIGLTAPCNLFSVLSLLHRTVPPSATASSIKACTGCHTSFLSVLSSPQDGASIGNSQLNQSLRQVSRAVVISPPNIGLTLEASLRSIGLRDAAEAARAVSCCLHLAAMQLPPRCVWVCADF